MPMHQDLPSLEKVKTAISEKEEKAVFTKMSITCSYKVGIQNTLYENLANFKLYNFVEEVEAKSAFYRGDQAGWTETILEKALPLHALHAWTLSF